MYTFIYMYICIYRVHIYVCTVCTVLYNILLDMSISF